MRKNRFFVGLLLIASLLISLPCLSAAAENKQKKPAGAYHGEVMELDLKAERMVVALNNSDLAMVFNTSKAKVGPEFGSLDKLKPGDQVQVTFEAKVGTIYALTITKGKKEEPVQKSKKDKSKNHP